MSGVLNKIMISRSLERCLRCYLHWVFHNVLVGPCKELMERYPDTHGKNWWKNIQTDMLPACAPFFIVYWNCLLLSTLNRRSYRITWKVLKIQNHGNGFSAVLKERSDRHTATKKGRSSCTKNWNSSVSPNLVIQIPELGCIYSYQETFWLKKKEQVGTDEGFNLLCKDKLYSSRGQMQPVVRLYLAHSHPLVPCKQLARLTEHDQCCTLVMYGGCSRV